MAFKIIQLLKLYKKILHIFAFEWMPDTIKEQAQKQTLLRESWDLIDEFTQKFKLDKIK